MGVNHLDRVGTARPISLRIPGDGFWESRGHHGCSPRLEPRVRIAHVGVAHRFPLVHGPPVYKPQLNWAREAVRPAFNADLARRPWNYLKSSQDVVNAALDYSWVNNR